MGEPDSLQPWPSIVDSFHSPSVAVGLVWYLLIEAVKDEYILKTTSSWRLMGKPGLC